jgi:plastocyanin
LKEVTMHPIRSRAARFAPALAAVTVLALAGCGSDDADAADAAASDASTPAATTEPTTKAPRTSAPATTKASSADVELAIAIEGRDIEPAPSRVKVPEGGTVRLTVTSDVDNELHVHGVEIYKDLVAGKPTTVTFTAEQTGLFEIETHEEPVLLLTQLQVQ